MNLKWNVDKIVSQKENTIYAYIENLCEYKGIEYYYEAKLIENSFPQELIDLCKARPGGFAIRRSPSIRIFNPPDNYPSRISRITNPD